MTFDEFMAKMAVVYGQPKTSDKTEWFDTYEQVIGQFDDYQPGFNRITTSREYSSWPTPAECRKALLGAIGKVEGLPAVPAKTDQKFTPAEPRIYIRPSDGSNWRAWLAHMSEAERRRAEVAQEIVVTARWPEHGRLLRIETGAYEHDLKSGFSRSGPECQADVELRMRVDDFVRSGVREMRSRGDSNA